LQKEEILRHKSFLPNDGYQYFELHPSGTPHTQVTEHAVERAILAQSLQKAPGPDKVSFGAIWLLWKWDKERIVKLARAAVHMG